MASLDYLLQLPRFLDSSRALANPGSIIAARSGRAVTLHFKSGLDLHVGPSEGEVRWPTVPILLWLAYCGAELVPPPSHDQQWAVDQAHDAITTPQGLTFTLDSLEPTIFTETFIEQSHYEPVDMRGRVVVDAGAFVGDSALYFAKLGAEVYAYEPDPANFARLQKNLTLNACGSHVHPIQKAVGIDGRVSFRFGRRGGSEGYLSGAAGGESVESVSLATILQTLPREPFLLKADIKGAEDEIVQQSAIRRFERLQIEDNGREGDGLPFLLSELASQGFRGIVCNPNRARAPLTKFGMLRMYRATTGARPPPAEATDGPAGSTDDGRFGWRNGPLGQ